MSLSVNASILPNCEMSVMPKKSNRCSIRPTWAPVREPSLPVDHSKAASRKATAAASMVSCYKFWSRVVAYVPMFVIVSKLSMFVIVSKFLSAPCRRAVGVAFLARRFLSMFLSACFRALKCLVCMLPIRMR